MEFLNDLWEVKGNRLEDFYDELKTLEKQTKAIPVNMDNYHFFSVSESEEGFLGIHLKEDTLWKKTKNSLTLRKREVAMSDFAKVGYSDEVIHQAFDSGLFLSYSSKIKKVSARKEKEMIEKGMFIPVSEKAMSTISSRINVRGNGFFNERLLRDMMIAKKFNKPVPTRLVVRTDMHTGLEKVFAVMSDKYTVIKQSIIKKIIDEITKAAKMDFGETKCYCWNIDHSITRLYLEFPDFAEEFKETYLEESEDEIIPGIFIETSDIGDCSFRMKGYYRLACNNTIIYMEEEYSRIHTGEISEEEILKAAKEVIFPKFGYYLDCMLNLMKIDITNDHMDDKAKVKAMKKAYRKVSKDMGLVKAIGKTREKQVMDMLISSINPDINYTGYDVAMSFLSVPEYVDLDNKSTIEAYRKATVHALMADLSEMTVEAEKAAA